MNVVSQAKIEYNYQIGNLKIRNVSNSNLVTTEVRSLELLAKKTASSEIFRPNDIITYTLVIQNPGNTRLTDVVVNDDLYHQKYVEGSFKSLMLDESNPNINLHLNENNLIFEIDQLLPNTVLVITYQVIIDNINELSMDIRNTSNVQSKEIKPFKTNSLELKQRFADIECIKSCVDFTYFDTELTYSIILKNHGNVDAIDLEVIDKLPNTFALNTKKPITINNNEVDIYSFDEDNKILNFIVDKVPANSEIEVLIKGKITK